MCYNEGMEKKLHEYEKQIEKKEKETTSPAERAKLAEYHKEMLANFQHERLIHLIVTLFFAMISVTFLFITAWAGVAYNFGKELLPLYILTALLTILTGFYVRHYYVLENHIQGLYKYTEKLLMPKSE